MTSKVDTVGFVGTGDIGSVIAGLTAESGLQVLISNSRGPDTLTEVAVQLGPNARAVTAEDAIAQSDLVVIAIPFARFRELPADRFHNRVVIDATNFIPFRDTNVSDEVGSDAPSQLLQRHLRGARVVKAFNNIYSGHLRALARPRGAADRSALPIAGDDATAKETVTHFLDRIGWDVVDTGSLGTSTLFDVGRPVFVQPYLADPSGTPDEWGARLTSDPGSPLSPDRVRGLIDAAASGN